MISQFFVLRVVEFGPPIQNVFNFIKVNKMPPVADVFFPVETKIGVVVWIFFMIGIQGQTQKGRYKLCK